MRLNIKAYFSVWMDNWLFKYVCYFHEVRISNKYYVNSIYIFELVTNSVNVINFFFKFHLYTNLTIYSLFLWFVLILLPFTRFIHSYHLFFPHSFVIVTSLSEYYCGGTGHLFRISHNLLSSNFIEWNLILVRYLLFDGFKNLFNSWDV